MNARVLPLRRPNGLRLLDLCSGAGGLSMGYYLAGFDVVGVDIAPMPNYPFPFIQADGLDYCADHGQGYDLVHGSWPCERYATVTKWRGNPESHPDLIGPGRQVMQATGRPWVIENVPETAAAGLLRPDYLLCGTAFGLSVRRHRVFETSWGGGGDLVAPCWHRKDLLPFEHKGERAYADAMGCTWMTNLEARKAVPPAYGQWIAEQFLTIEGRTAA
ncbi:MULTISPECIES: DNA cytosine methyltransferase [unclassified Streptomyces]|uniref:DNA cytosine methyltransferase n=1 Tax=unclassified Streptomyces TaxID=2593676 RepID=UPI00224CEAD5|nr:MULTISPECIES: DNA cytosine methyltransferase [unclassified Streptomyces]MCX4991358.1 DNA cytosine methyltransferase [Streptomyces sp. NBC_00568]MCX5003405.1 DNA cytosine methyltransferase [Streptomyces sp. NBC_00638]